jgi:glycosyltransferase involved in cell wall biosynthesis
MLGRVTNRETLAGTYSMAVIPSLYESFSLTALESLACGTLIIMAKLPPTDWYTKEISAVKPGTGLTFRPGDSPEN